MHIVIFVDYPDASLGGTQTSVRGQRKALERAGHIVTMVTPPPKGEVPNDPDTIFVPGFPYTKYEYPLVVPSKRLERWIEAELVKRPPVDIIHLQTNVGIGIMGVHIAKRLKKPLVQTMHTRDDVFMQKTLKFPLSVTAPAYLVHKFQLKAPPTSVHRLDDPVSAYYSWRVMVHHAQQADVVTVPSRHFAEKLKAHGVTKPVEVISNGLDDDMLVKFWKEEQVQSGFKKPLKLTWVNRLSAEKRPMLCIDAIQDLPDVSLDFYGLGPDTALIERRIKELKLEDRVRLRGRVSQEEIVRAISRSDIFVLSSYQFDTQSMVLLESVAASVPVILSDPDLVESLPEGGYILTSTPDAAGLRAAIKEVLDNPDKLLAMRAIMHENRESVLQSKMTKQMVDVYEKAINLAAVQG